MDGSSVTSYYNNVPGFPMISQQAIMFELGYGDMCMPNPCQNGGTCSMVSHDSCLAWQYQHSIEHTCDDAVIYLMTVS